MCVCAESQSHPGTTFHIMQGKESSSTSKMVQAAHPVLHQRRHRMCAGDITGDSVTYLQKSHIVWCCAVALQGPMAPVLMFWLLVLHSEANSK